MVETPTSYCFFVKINGRDRPQRQKRVRNDRRVIVQGSHGREKGRELFFLFPTLKRSGRMIFFNKVVKRSGKMKSANGNFPKVQITRKFGIDLLQ